MVASVCAVFVVIQKRNGSTIVIAKMTNQSISPIVRRNGVRCGVWVVGVRYETNSQCLFFSILFKLIGTIQFLSFSSHFNFSFCFCYCTCTMYVRVDEYFAFLQCNSDCKRHRQVVCQDDNRNSSISNCPLNIRPSSTAACCHFKWGNHWTPVRSILWIISIGYYSFLVEAIAILFY